MAQGLRFNGLTDYVSIPNTSLQFGTGDFTIEHTIVVPRIPANLIISFGSSDSYNVWMGVDNGGQASLSVVSIATITGGNIADGLPHTLTALRRGTTIYFYVDGIQKNSLVYTQATYFGTTSIGRYGSGGFNFGGQIRNVRVYNRALADSEVAANYAGTVTRSGLVGEWLFQAGNGSTAFDTSGNGNNGTITGATWVQPKKQQGLKFTRGSSNYVSVSSPSFTNVTYEYWVKVDTLDGLTQISLSTDQSANYFGFSSGKFMMSIQQPTQKTLASNAIPNMGQWYHVVGTCNGSLATLYVNGVLDNSTTVTGMSSSFMAKLGNYVDNSYGFNGSIGSARVYNRALTAAEVAANYVGNVTRSGLVGEWLLNEGTGTTATDTSGNGNHGAINGATWLVKRQELQGLKFNGLSDYVDCGSFVPLPAFSVEVKLKADILAFQQPISQQPFATDNGWSIKFRLDGSVWFRVGFESTHTDLICASVYAPGETLTLKCVLDGTTMYMYKNGTLIGSRTATLGVPLTNTLQQMAIGKSTAANVSEFFSGSIYRVTLYDASGNIARNYLLNEGAGTFTTDTSGKGNNGTVVGATWVAKSGPKKPRKNLLPPFTDPKWTLHENTRMQVADFSGKVSGSTVENPHRTFIDNTQATLRAPNQFVTEFGQTPYASIANLDGTLRIDSSSANGNITQHLFSFNIVEHIIRKFGVSVFGAATTLADRIAWCKAGNVSKLSANWSGFGSGPAGNKATFAIFTTGWITSQFHNLSSVSKLIASASTNNTGSNPQPNNTIDANGFVHFLAYPDASDGVTASTINTDTVNLEVYLTEAAYTPLRQAYTLGLNATASGQDSTILRIPCLPNTQYIFSFTGSGIAYLRDTDLAGNNIYQFSAKPQGSWAFTTRTTAVSFDVIITNGNNGAGSFTFTNPQLELGSAATAFEAYQLLPDNKPIPLVPKKNMVPTDPINWIVSTNTVYCDIPLPNKTSFTISSRGSYDIGVDQKDIGGTTLLWSGYSALATIVPNASTVSLRVWIKRWDGALMQQSEIAQAKPQVEQGSVATAYEAYKLIYNVKQL